MKKVLITTLIVICVLTMFILIGLNDTKKRIYKSELLNFESIREAEEFKEELAKALKEQYGDNYEEIITRNNAAADTALVIENSFSKSKTAVESKYPDYYGGMY